MDPDIIKKTQETLGKAIKKPPLTEKLLTKPPFRFLHDVITEVIKNTGVLKGLYSEDDLDSSNVSVKEAKMTFLQKAIDCVGIAVGEILTARPSKIVSGHEAEKTNEFLQYLGRLCLEKCDTSEAVKSVLDGGKPTGKKRKKEESIDTKGTKDSKDSKDSRESKESRELKDSRESKESRDSKDSRDSKEKKGKHKSEKSSKVTEDDGENEDKEKKDKKKKHREKRSHDSVDDKEVKKGSKKEDSNKDGTDTKSKSAKEDISSDHEGKEPKKADRPKDKGEKKEKDVMMKRTYSLREGEDGEGEEGDEMDVADKGTKRIQRPSTAKGQRRKQHTTSEDTALESTINTTTENTIQRHESAVRRPSSARPAPPRIKKREDKLDEPQQISNQMSNPSIIIDTKQSQDDDDDDELFIMEENPTLRGILDASNTVDKTSLDDEEHGSLVRKMLDSKKDADNRDSNDLNNRDTTTKNDGSFLPDAARKKAREQATKELDRLRAGIQQLVSKVHPMGSLMNYMQENVDSMEKELETWREENKKHRKALNEEKMKAEKELAPLYSHLADIEQEMADIVENISAVKSNILRNEEKMEDLIMGASRV